MKGKGNPTAFNSQGVENDSNESKNKDKGKTDTNCTSGHSNRKNGFAPAAATKDLVNGCRLHVAEGVPVDSTVPASPGQPQMMSGDHSVDLTSLPNGLVSHTDGQVAEENTTRPISLYHKTIQDNGYLKGLEESFDADPACKELVEIKETIKETAEAQNDDNDPEHEPSKESARIEYFIFHAHRSPDNVEKMAKYYHTHLDDATVSASLNTKFPEPPTPNNSLQSEIDPEPSPQPEPEPEPQPQPEPPLNQPDEDEKLRVALAQLNGYLRATHYIDLLRSGVQVKDLPTATNVKPQSKFQKQRNEFNLVAHILAQTEEKSDDWLRVNVCHDFLNGGCRLPDGMCLKAHVDEHHHVYEGKVVLCFDHMKDRCTREHCVYFHAPEHIKKHVHRTGQQIDKVKAALKIENAVDQDGQLGNVLTSSSGYTYNNVTVVSEDGIADPHFANPQISMFYSSPAELYTVSDAPHNVTNSREREYFLLKLPLEHNQQGDYSYQGVFRDYHNYSLPETDEQLPPPQTTQQRERSAPQRLSLAQMKELIQNYQTIHKPNNYKGKNFRRL